VASLQSVGVILVVAMLIIPASTALLLSNRLPYVLVLSAVVGLLSASIGLILAILWETTPGPAMTLVATAFYLLAMLFSPEKGLIVHRIRRYQRQGTQALEDVLKALVKLQEKGIKAEADVAAAMLLSPARLRKQLRALQGRKWVTIGAGHDVQLTASGLQRGYQLIRAHRIWESYLVQEMGLQADDVILSVNGYQLEDFDAWLAEQKPGAKVRVKLWRRGKEISLTGKLDAYPAPLFYLYKQADATTQQRLIYEKLVGYPF
jgi:hypothetical protein